MAVRASALNPGHASISTPVRPQPMQNCVRGSITHTLMQGLVSVLTTSAFRHSDRAVPGR
jgi:hypothetical protein